MLIHIACLVAISGLALRKTSVSQSIMRTIFAGQLSGDINKKTQKKNIYSYKPLSKSMQIVREHYFKIITLKRQQIKCQILNTVLV